MYQKDYFKFEYSQSHKFDCGVFNILFDGAEVMRAELLTVVVMADMDGVATEDGVLDPVESDVVIVVVVILLVVVEVELSY